MDTQMKKFPYDSVLGKGEERADREERRRASLQKRQARQAQAGHRELVLPNTLVHELYDTHIDARPSSRQATTKSSRPQGTCYILPAAPPRQQIVIAAIDFGTTYSGYAFSFKHEYEINPLQIRANEWKNVSQGQMNVKTPTCLLLNPNKTLHSFGHEAKAKYIALTLENQHKDWYFFWQFKMELHQEKEIRGNFMLKDENGKKLDALTVFSLSIQYLKQHLMEVLKNAYQGINDKDVLWVITVPAIWNDSAKKFMRQAAQKAGINKDCIEIALEPEAASIYCMQLPISRDPETPAGMTKFPPGTRYMILDCGGGTVDITVHEVLEDGNLKELHRASGGHWGGTVVNKDFLNFIRNLVSTEVFDEFSKSDQSKSDYLEFLEDFENKKRMTKSDSTDVVTIRLPVGLQQLLMGSADQPLNEQAFRSSYRAKVHILGDKLRIQPEDFKRFFSSAVRDIVDHVHDLIESLPLPVSAILMVGGFSESPILQKAIRDAFEGELEKKVIVPVDASLCVMKGAVLYGHKPSNITERQCRYTYGVAMTQRFDRRIHKADKKATIDGKVLCIDLFDKHVEIGQSVKSGTPQASREYQTLSSKDTGFDIVIYKSSNRNPTYIDDPGCEYVGHFVVKRPTRRARDDRKSDVINVRFVFGNSDIEVEAIGEGDRVHKADFRLDV